MLSALLGPGVGQLYNRQWLKGIAFLSLFLFLLLAVAGYFVYGAKIAIEQTAQSNPDMFFQPGFEMRLARQILAQNRSAVGPFKWTCLTLWVLSIADAFFSARRGRSKSNEQVAG